LRCVDKTDGCHYHVGFSDGEELYFLFVKT